MVSTVVAMVAAVSEATSPAPLEAAGSQEVELEETLSEARLVVGMARVAVTAAAAAAVGPPSPGSG